MEALGLKVERRRKSWKGQSAFRQRTAYMPIDKSQVYCSAVSILLISAVSCY